MYKNTDISLCILTLAILVQVYYNICNQEIATKNERLIGYV